MMEKLIRAAFTLVTALVGTACSSSSGSSAGIAGAACYANGTCNSGLTCTTGACVVVGGSGGTDASSDDGTYASSDDGTYASPSCGTDASPSCGTGERYSLLGSGLVEDTCTGLTWMMIAFQNETTGTTPDQATGYCAENKMRLPTEDEALAIAGSNDAACAWSHGWQTWTSTFSGAVSYTGLDLPWAVSSGGETAAGTANGSAGALCVSGTDNDGGISSSGSDAGGVRCLPHTVYCDTANGALGSYVTYSGPLSCQNSCTALAGINLVTFCDPSCTIWCQGFSASGAGSCISAGTCPENQACQ
jgi:hypothetical protein